MLLKSYFENISEKEYRDSDRVSYSLLKGFSEAGPKVLIEPKQGPDGPGLLLGSIVDKLLTMPDYNPSDDYKIVDKTIDFNGSTHIHTLLKFLRDNPDINIFKEEEGVLYQDVEAVERLFPILEFKRPPVLTDDFWESAALLKNIHAGIKMISTVELMLAYRMVEVLKSHPHTVNLFNPPLEIEVIKQAIIFFTINGVECKCMIDWLLIDHNKKVLYPFDIKTGTDLKFMDNFFRYKYYIQGSMYHTGLRYLLDTNKELSGYRVDSTFSFIYISRENPELPLVYAMDKYYIDKTLTGYATSSGYRVRGIVEMIDDIKWHREEGKYEYNREIYQNSGVIQITNPIDFYAKIK